MAFSDRRQKGSKPFMITESQLYIRAEDGFSDELKKIYNVGKDITK